MERLGHSDAWIQIGAGQAPHNMSTMMTMLLEGILLAVEWNTSLQARPPSPAALHRPLKLTQLALH